jgi:hypothetical protein
VNDSIIENSTNAPASPEEELTLLELVDRLLDKGVVLTGDVTLSVADVDLVYVGLRVLISSVDAAQRAGAMGATAGGGA